MPKKENIPTYNSDSDMTDDDMEDEERLREKLAYERHLNIAFNRLRQVLPIGRNRSQEEIVRFSTGYIKCLKQVIIKMCEEELVSPSKKMQDQLNKLF